MRDAQIAGYMNGTAEDIDEIFRNVDDMDFASLPISYDATKEGALEFYNRLYSAEYEAYNQHKLLCLDENNKLINTEVMNVERNENFEPFDLGMNECDNSINANNQDADCKS